MSTNQPPWFSTGRREWHHATQEWLELIATELGLAEPFAFEILKERPWSLVAQVTFGRQITYFKACAVAGDFEPALLKHLHTFDGRLLPKLLAVEEQEGWLLLSDGGRPIRDMGSASEQIEVWQSTLPLYAALQLESLNQTETLKHLGLPDRRPERLPQLLLELMADPISVVGREPAEAAALRHAIDGRLNDLESICRRLTLPTAIDHGDLHGGNLLIGHRRPSRPTLIDWGDACLTHPFCSLMVCLQTTLEQLPAGEQPAWQSYLRDAYLEPWEVFGPRASLQQEFEQAQWIAPIVRALDYARMFKGTNQQATNWQPLIFDCLDRWTKRELPRD